MGNLPHNYVFRSSLPDYKNNQSSMKSLKSLLERFECNSIRFLKRWRSNYTHVMPYRKLYNWCLIVNLLACEEPLQLIINGIIRNFILQWDSRERYRILQLYEVFRLTELRRKIWPNDRFTGDQKSLSTLPFEFPIRVHYISNFFSLNGDKTYELNLKHYLFLLFTSCRIKFSILNTSQCEYLKIFIIL